MKNYVLKNITLLLCLVLYSCNSNVIEKENSEPYFEGEITVSDAQGLYGTFLKVHTTYYISENYLKREQRLGGLTSVMGTFAGIIVDLEKDSVTLYYVDKLLSKKEKHMLSVASYKEAMDSIYFPNAFPSPVDDVFTIMGVSKEIYHTKDSMKIGGFESDYTLYHNDIGNLKQGIFDTKEIKVKRELLELVFLDLPKKINFPLQSEITTTLSDVSNDTIISGEITKGLDRELRGLLQKGDSTIKDETDLDKLAKNRLVRFGVDVLKKGVDLNIHLTRKVSKVKPKGIDIQSHYSPLEGFVVILLLDDFLDALPIGGDFDD